MDGTFELVPPFFSSEKARCMYLFIYIDDTCFISVLYMILYVYISTYPLSVHFHGHVSFTEWNSLLCHERIHCLNLVPQGSRSVGCVEGGMAPWLGWNMVARRIWSSGCKQHEYIYIYPMSKWTNVCLQVDQMPRITEKLTMFVGKKCCLFFLFLLWTVPVLVFSGHSPQRHYSHILHIWNIHLTFGI